MCIYEHAYICKHIVSLERCRYTRRPFIGIFPMCYKLRYWLFFAINLVGRHNVLYFSSSDCRFHTAPQCEIETKWYRTDKWRHIHLTKRMHYSNCLEKAEK